MISSPTTAGTSTTMTRYPFGAVYLLEPEYTWTEIERDMRHMRDHGFTHITLWPAANSWLANRPNEYVFTDTLRYLDLAHSLDLRVIVQLIGQNQSQEFAPDCLMRPDMLLRDPGAGAAAGNGKGWNNCFWANLNHPDVDALVKHYLETCVAALRHHPAVCGWDIFNEAHFRSDDPHTTARYHDWLRARYDNDIKRLNRLWFRRYSDFSQINPDDRDAPYSVWSSILPLVEYEHFRSQNLNDICARWAAWTRAADPAPASPSNVQHPTPNIQHPTNHPVLDAARHSPTFDVGCSTLDVGCSTLDVGCSAAAVPPPRPIIIDGTSGQLLEQSISGRNNDEFATARVPHCDIFGGTFYPKSWGRDLGDRPWELLAYYSMSRAAAHAAQKPYYVNELQTHTQSVLTPGSEMPPATLSLYIWAAIAAGAEAMQLWRWRPFLRGYQASGRGLTRLDGTPGPRAVAVAALTQTLRENETTITTSRPVPADVKILVNYRARVIYDAYLKGAPSHQPDSIRGWHRAFTALGLAVENASLEHLTAADLATPVLVLPATIAVTDEQASWLSNYVRNGGTLISEARLAILDDNGLVRSEGSPGHTLSETFGIIERDVGPAGEFTWGGHRLPAPFMTQQLELRQNASTKTLAREAATGWPMVVENHYGRGRTLYFASIQGIAWREQLCPHAQNYFANLFPADHPRLLRDKPETLLIRWHENPTTGDTLAYLMNFDTSEATISPPGSDNLIHIPAQSTCLHQTKNGKARAPKSGVFSANPPGDAQRRQSPTLATTD